MKKVKLFKKVLLMLLVFAFICGVSVINKATGNVEDLLNDSNVTNIEHVNTSTGDNSTNTANTAQTNTQGTNTQTANIAAVQNNTANKTTNTTTLPKTGVSDTAMWVLVIACVIAAVYTYKKVRDYNI